MELPEWQKRVYAEWDELLKRIAALRSFRAEGFYANLEAEDQRLLERQLEAMQQYEAVLRARVKRF